MSKLNSILRKIYNYYNRMRLKNRNITLIASNCNGGIILSDLRLPFNSPFINLWVPPKDFLTFCENMEYYLSQPLTFIDEKNINYPIALIDDIKICFQHYHNKENANYCWNKRKQRIDMKHIFILFTDRDGCTYEDLQRFDKLKFRNKAVLVHKKYPDIKSSIYIPGFEHQNCVGMCMEFKNKFTYKRYLDAFDYVYWFNSEYR